MASELERLFLGNRGRLVHKWLHYLDIYDRHFNAYRGRAVTVVEFGVFHGGSLQMWKTFFGRRARIMGVDIDPRCAALTEPGIEIVIGDQDDRAFLQTFREDFGPVDVVIDDGGHRMTQQIATFEEMWPAVADGGVYLAEDLHTSYWPEYGGAHGRRDTFVEYAKDLIDQMHAWHSRDQVPVTDFTRSIKAMHIYDSVIVFDKGEVSKPEHRMTGFPSFDEAVVDPAD